MTLPLVMAVRVQATLDQLAASKARPAAEVQAEARLRERLAAVLQPLVDQVAAGVDDLGRIPTDEVRARALLGELGPVEQQLLDALEVEVGQVAAQAIAAVERKVGAAVKQLPDALRPSGMDRRLADTLARIGSRMLGRFTARTIDALVQAADVDLPVGQLRELLAELLAGELRQLSRHAVGDARNEATEVAERDLGVRRHRWVTAGDGDVRPAHAAVDGEVVEIGEPFSNGWRRPGGIGCRCRLEPVLDE